MFIARGGDRRDASRDANAETAHAIWKTAQALILLGLWSNRLTDLPIADGSCGEGGEPVPLGLVLRACCMELPTAIASHW